MKKIRHNDCRKDFDKSIFYNNDFAKEGADPGALYVDKKMSKETWSKRLRQRMS